SKILRQVVNINLNLGVILCFIGLQRPLVKFLAPFSCLSDYVKSGIFTSFKHKGFQFKIAGSQLEIESLFRLVEQHLGLPDVAKITYHQTVTQRSGLDQVVALEI